MIRIDSTNPAASNLRPRQSRVDCAACRLGNSLAILEV